MFYLNCHGFVTGLNTRLSFNSSNFDLVYLFNIRHLQIIDIIKMVSVTTFTSRLVSIIFFFRFIFYWFIVNFQIFQMNLFFKTELIFKYTCIVRVNRYYFIWTFPWYLAPATLPIIPTQVSDENFTILIAF